MDAHPPSSASRLPTGRLWVATLAALVAFVSLASVTPAWAYYEESHVTGDVARVTVDRVGAARVEHTLTWRVVAGQPRTLDLLDTEPRAVPEPTARLQGDDGQSLTATLAPLPGRGLRLTVLEPKLLRRGQLYRVTLAYGVNLVESGELSRAPDGAAFRLVWNAPLPAEGYEVPSVTFVVPTARQAPTAILGDEGMRDDGVVATVTSLADHDEIALVRPHVGRGEALPWVVRVSSSAFEGGPQGQLLAPPPPPTRDGAEGPSACTYGLVVLLAVAFAASIRAKERSFDAACVAFGESARGLVPLRSWERSAAGGAALFVGISLQLGDGRLVGALAVVLAMACAVLLPPRVPSPARGPGTWLVLRPEDAFGQRAGARTRARPCLTHGVMQLGVVLLFVGVGRLLAASHPEAPQVLTLDALATAPLFLTGLASQLPPDRATARNAWLGRLFCRLEKARSLRVSPWVRVPAGRVQPDEVRVRVLPRDALPGLAAIEIGFAWMRTRTSFVSMPTVLVRVEEATAASARMTTLAPSVVPVPGRKPEERVYRLDPRTCSRRATAALVLGVGRKLVDRRASPDVWEGEDRRVPPLLVAVERQVASPNEPFPVPA